MEKSVFSFFGKTKRKLVAVDFVKFCLACSGGGHLSELLQLLPFFEKTNHFFLTDHRENSDELAKTEKVFFVKCPRRNPANFVINFFQSLKIFFKEKPDAVVSTGADTAIAFCIIAKLFGKKLVFIESFCRVSSPSVSARIEFYLRPKYIIAKAVQAITHPKELPRIARSAKTLAKHLMKRSKIGK